MNIEELKKINQRYLNTHYEINEIDEKNINNLIGIIEKTRDNKTPKTGDIVKFTTEHGEYFGNALISNIWENGEIEICECPYTPFFAAYNPAKNSIKLSVSGGSFHDFNKSIFKYIGTGKRKFCDWGSCGACEDGAIDFYANVNVWELKQENKFDPYTTEKYNKMYINKLEKPTDLGYIILGNGIAFKNEKDYNAFLKTYRAKEFQGYCKNQTVIFYYKEENYYISKEEWEKLENCQIDTRLCNGSIITVKVKYDDENKKIIVYRYSNRFEEEEEIANKPYILNR